MQDCCPHFSVGFFGTARGAHREEANDVGTDAKGRNKILLSSISTGRSISGLLPLYAAGPPPTATIDAATLEIAGTHAKQRQQLAAAAANFKRDSMEPSKSLLVF